MAENHIPDARRSLLWIVANTSPAGNSSTRSANLSRVWAESRYALQHLREDEEIFRTALVEITAISKPEMRTQNKRDLGRGLTQSHQLALEALELESPLLDM